MNQPTRSSKNARRVVSKTPGANARLHHGMRPRRPPQDRTSLTSEKPGKLANILTGKNFFITALVTAVLGVTVPKGIDLASDAFTDPLNITASQSPSTDGGVLLLPSITPAGQALPDPGESALAEMEARGGIAADNLGIRLIIRGNSAGTVAITNIRARIIGRQPATTGTLFYSPPEGSDDAVRVGLQLGAGDPVVRDITDNSRLVDPHFARRVYNLKRNEAAVFEIEVHATKGTFDFDIAVDFVDGNENQTAYVGNGERPFRVSSLSSEYGSVVINVGDAYAVRSSEEFCKEARRMCEDTTH